MKNKHNSGENLASSLKSLTELNTYGHSLLEEITRRSSTISGREVYLAALYFSALAQAKGIIRLFGDGQYRAGTGPARSLYEIWINTQFIYCDRNLIYVRYLTLSGERKRVRILRLLETDGHITLTELEEHQKKLAAFEKWFGMVYSTWPEEIPLIINPNNGEPVSRIKEFSLKDRCAIIDHYNRKYHRTNPKYLSMTEHYERLYPHLSGAPHADPVELNSAFKRMGDAIQIDIDGSRDKGAMIGLTDAVFLFHFQIIRTVKHRILKEPKPKMPSWLNLHAKDLGLFG